MRIATKDFKDISKTSNPHNVDETLNFVHHRIIGEMNKELTRTFKVEDVKEAIFQCYPQNLRVPMVSHLYFSINFGIQ